jgi:hypothetical protein
MGLAASVVDGRYRLGAVTAVTRDVVVYIADDTATGRQIAVEILRDEVAADADFVAAVHEQAGKLATPACAHRAIARVYECGLTDAGVLFVALQRTVGRTLREVLEARGPLDPYNALRIAIQVGEALEILHHRGIVHGELRPESVVLVTNQQVTEHAKVVGIELTAAHRTVIGVRRRDAALLPYLAPEQIERGETTEAADVHALGRLIRDLLTAEPSRESRVPRLPTPAVPASIASIIATALNPRPDQRYADITLMLNDMWGAQSELDDPKARPRAVTRQPLPKVPWLRVQYRELGLQTVLTGGGIVLAALVWIAAAGGLVSRARAPVPALMGAPTERSAAPSPEATPAPDATPAPESAPPSDAMQPAEVGSTRVLPSPPSAGDPGATRISEPGPTEGAPSPSVAAPAQRRPAEARALVPRNQPDSDGSDGTAIIDWLLKKRN